MSEDPSLFDDGDAKQRATNRIARIKSRMARWCEKHADRLAEMHPDVALEVRSLQLDRLLTVKFQALTIEDLRLCRMRVATRLRVKRYGPCTGDEESGRQLREVLEDIDGVSAELEAA